MHTLKHLFITSILLSLLSIAEGQSNRKDTSWYDGCNWHHCVGELCDVTTLNCTVLDLPESDTLTASRFIADSLSNSYMVEYCYADESNGYISHTNKDSSLDIHKHYVALVSIIKYNGNKQTIIAQNIKAIYSPTECSSDNPELWRKKLYHILNKKPS